MGWGQLLGGAAGLFFGGGSPAGALAGAALGGALDEATGGGQTGAAREAAQIANASSDRALALQQRMYDESIARQQPYYQAGVNALPGYLKGIAAGGEYVRPFTMADFAEDPGAQYAKRKMFEDYAAQRSALGLRDSGATRLGILQAGENFSNLRYRESLNDFLKNQELRRNAAAGVAGYGPTSNALAATAGERLVTGSAPLMQNQGYNTANAMLAGERARQSSYGDIGKVFGSGGFSNMFGNYGRSEGPVSMPGYGGMYDPAYMGR
jgi:hypothetical protein